MKKPIVVCVDGLDGSGKTTLLRNLAAIEHPDFSIVRLRDPGTTAMGERIRNLLLDDHLPRRRATETLLFTAARSELIGQLVPQEKQVVYVLDRFSPSTFVYQLSDLFGFDKLDTDKERNAATRAFHFLNTIKKITGEPEIDLWVYTKLSSFEKQKERMSKRTDINHLDSVNPETFASRSRLYDRFFKLVSTVIYGGLVLDVEDTLNQQEATDLVFKQIVALVEELE